MLSLWTASRRSNPVHPLRALLGYPRHLKTEGLTAHTMGARRRVEEASRFAAMKLILAAALVACLAAPTYASIGNGPQEHPLEKFTAEDGGLKSFAVNLNPAYSITLNTTTQTTTGQYFLATIVGPGAATDVVALYAPAPANYNTQIFVKYITGNQIPGYVGKGIGQYVFQNINYRVDTQFVMFTGGVNTNTLQTPNYNIIATSPIIRNMAPNQPVQGHLMATTDPSAMLIQWVTKNATSPTVKFGLTSGQYTASKVGTTATYTINNLCSGIAQGTGYFDPGSIHTANMTGLTPATRYYYIYGSDAYGYSPENSFVSVPANGSLTEVKIIMSADNGQAHMDGSNEVRDEKPSIAVSQAIAAEVKNGYTMNVHNGDLAYADGFLADWDNYYEQMSLFAQSMPFMTVPGNHERDFPFSGDAFINPGSTDSRGECGVVYNQRQRMPQQPGWDSPTLNANASGANLRLYYSFEYGPIHFLQYDSESPFEPGTLQYEWILRDLASVDRTRTPWLIVGVHRMFYCDSSDYSSNDNGDQTMAARQRAALEEVFNQYKIDAMFYGHEHIYERTCPVKNGVCQPSTSVVNTGTLNVQGANTTTILTDPTAPVYYLIGNAGRALTTYSFLETPVPAIYQNVNSVYGYVRMRVNATTLITEAVAIPGNYVFDTVTIIKSAPTPVSPPTKTEAIRAALGNITNAPEEIAKGIAGIPAGLLNITHG